jgi:hypothetical protein
MFISRLIAKIATYDRFGEHHINGFKALYITELLFIFNFFYSVPHPYFFYFYVPLTAFAAEIAGTTLRDKYLALVFTLVGSTVAIFLFGLFSVYKSFFVLFTFCFSFAIYLVALHRIKSMFVAAPIILSLAVYSLIYKNADSNLYIALNNALETLVATLVILVGLYTFPKTYYLRIWQKAFFTVIQTLTTLSEKIHNDELKGLPIISGIITMDRYSMMLSRTFNYYSVLRITRLSFELIMGMSYLFSFKKQLRAPYILALNQYLLRFATACKQNQPLLLSAHDSALLKETHELKSLYRLILSWNYLCRSL